MIRHPAAPFRDRLRLARMMVARGASRPPAHIADQLDAAGRETRTLHRRMTTVLPALEPTRNWRYRAAAGPSDDVRTLLLAALLGCVNVCIHLRRGGPRPAFARLPLGRVDCDRCSATVSRPVTGADQCDVCTASEIEVFWPFCVQVGPLMMAGDACEACADVLGIRISEAAS